MTTTLTTTELEALLGQAWRASPAAAAVRWSNGEWRRAPHLDLISDELSTIAEGPQRIIVNIPPGHGKSEEVSKWLPFWALANWPRMRIGLISYEASFAAGWGLKVKDLIEEHGPEIGLALRPDVQAKNLWQLETDGYMATAGVGGPITGRRFDLIIVDDPIKTVGEVRSAVLRDHLWDWWQSVLRTRLAKGGSVVVIMHRWHADDLCGRLLNPEHSPRWRQWKVIRLPAIAEGQDDPLGRREGQPLWEEMYDLEALDELREDVGPETWIGKYQQRPAREQGQLFRWEWFRERRLASIPPGRRVYQFWDTAAKTKESNDFTVCTTMTDLAAPNPQGYGVMHVLRRRLEYPEMIKQMVQMAERFRPHRIFIEDASSGQAAVQTLKRETNLPIFGVTVLADKRERANQVTGTIEAGRVYLPEEADWLQDWFDEILGFPEGAVHDDQVDSFVGCLTQLVNRTRTGMVGGFYIPPEYQPRQA